MKKILSIILFFCCCNIVAFSQSISVYFEIIPEEQLIQIDANRRKDMVDLIKAGREAKFANKLGGVSEMTTLTDNYLDLQVSESFSFAMKMLPIEDGENILAIVKSVCGEACDSELTFYSVTWERISNNDLIELPLRSEFFNEGADEIVQSLINNIDMDIVKLSLDATSNRLTAEYELEKYYPSELYELVQPFLKKAPITYEWNGKRFVRR